MMTILISWIALSFLAYAIWYAISLGTDEDEHE